MKLFFIRHGQTFANIEHWYSGQSDVQLTEQGKQQAMALEPILKNMTFDKVYTSDLSRAMITQQLALPGVTGIPLPLLREYSVGSLTGKDIGWCNDQYGPFHGDYTPFGGENTPMVCDRVRQFLAMLEADPCERVAAFAHNGLMKCVLRVLLGENSAVANITNGNCNIAVFEYKGNSWKMLCWNYGKEL